MNISQFISRLEQAKAWTDRLTKNVDYGNGWYGTVLRQTNPRIGGKSLFAIEGDYTTWNVDPYERHYFQQALQAVWTQKEEALGASVPVLKGLAEHGRILCFFPGHTTHDGAAIVASQCFVDESDVPPIDTWFYLEGDYTLFCWIPKGLEPVMQAAMDVDMLGSYAWLEDESAVLYARLTTALQAERLLPTALND